MVKDSMQHHIQSIEPLEGDLYCAFYRKVPTSRPMSPLFRPVARARRTKPRAASCPTKKPVRSRIRMFLLGLALISCYNVEVQLEIISAASTLSILRPLRFSTAMMPFCHNIFATPFARSHKLATGEIYTKICATLPLIFVVKEGVVYKPHFYVSRL